MPVRVKIDGDKITYKIERTITGNMGILASQILRDCNRYCKEDTGMLIMSSLIHSDLNHGILVWQTPYAARQYYEIKTAHKDVNHEASWRWCEVAKQNHGKRWAEQAQAIARYYG